MAVLIYLNGLLISRLCYVFHDGPLPDRTLYGLGIAQAVLALAVFGLTGGTAFVLPLALLVLIAPERWLPAAVLNESRLVGLGLVLLSAALMADHLTPAAWWSRTGPVLLQLFGAWHLSGPAVHTGAWATFGFWLVANEVNLLIRCLFHRFQLEPRLASKDSAETTDLDQREYNAGRIIGILERWLMYSVMVASHNITVIAVIMAAKGFARFRQLEERAFAEYVLIGTLASTLLTLLIAQGISGPMQATAWNLIPKP